MFLNVPSSGELAFVREISDGVQT